ncbi:Protein sgm1 [Orchesella cincta]|uniref:Protein sgm1 n=1 Tax=Orchesella cincta TaxID=48709 RepID=A0A1D2MK01_ORCCI|nr:Protein sgm1 [Orchesella cincta]
MAFSKAPIRRFNEPTDQSIPPPGTYDPKFMTDVAVSSTLKGLVFEKWGRANGTNSKARPEDNELSHSGRISRNSSFSRRPSITAVTAAKKTSASQITHTSKSVRRIRSRSPSSVGNNNTLQPTQSFTSSRRPVSNAEVKGKIKGAVKQDEHKSSHAVTLQTNDIVTASSVCQDVLSHIQEIEKMAESLQVEVSEYKRRLANELIRNQELEAKKLELEFTIQSLRRELGKYESAKEAWEFGEQSQKKRMDELVSTKAQLEHQISELQDKMEDFKEKESNLLGKIALLDQSKSGWQSEKEDYEQTLKQLQNLLKTQEQRASEWETKCEELLTQIDSCYQTCEAKVADAENSREIFEVKVQELTQQKEDLQKMLDTMGRELETEKTLMELMKSEQVINSNKQEKYIS